METEFSLVVVLGVIGTVFATLHHAAGLVKYLEERREKQRKKERVGEDQVSGTPDA